MHLASLHAGQSIDDVRENTGWELKIQPDLIETAPPSREEMAALHEIDKDGFWR